MKHALVVGGSGMLAEASLWLEGQGYRVSVIGRNEHKLERLVRQAEHIYPVSVDYHDHIRLGSMLADTVNIFGPFELVVAWIHRDSQPVIDIIADSIKHAAPSLHWDLYHVLGSSSDLDAILRKIRVSPNCSYHQVQLGFVIEGNHSRWLTHAEISGGVIHSIQTRSKRHVVGTLTPWHKRP